MKGFKNVEIIQEDVLKADLSSLVSKCPKFKVAANLPFYLTAPVIRKLLENKKQPELMALIVQKEVAQRIAAKPPKMSILAVSVQFYAKAEIVRYISKKSFWPRPKVDSALIIISPQAENILDSGLFFKIVRAGFSQPRKQIGNNLSKKLRLNKEDVKSWLLKNRIDPGRRAETLYIKDWLNLTKTYKA